MSITFEQRCTKLTVWRHAHDGAIPRQRGGDAEESYLGNWVSMTLPRKNKCLGSKPSQRKLTFEEASMLDAALNPHGAANAVTSDVVQLAAGTCRQQGRTDNTDSSVAEQLAGSVGSGDSHPALHIMLAPLTAAIHILLPRSTHLHRNELR